MYKLLLILLEPVLACACGLLLLRIDAPAVYAFKSAADKASRSEPIVHTPDKHYVDRHSIFSMQFYHSATALSTRHCCKAIYSSETHLRATSVRLQAKVCQLLRTSTTRHDMISSDCVLQKRCANAGLKRKQNNTHERYERIAAARYEIHMVSCDAFVARPKGILQRSNFLRTS